jgi:hypothetical protein
VIRELIIFAYSVVAPCIFSVSYARSAGLDGAWANDDAICGKIYRKKDNRILVAKDADLYGNWFIRLRCLD